MLNALSNNIVYLSRVDRKDDRSLATCHPPILSDSPRNMEVVIRNVRRVNNATEFYFYATKVLFIASFTLNATIRVSRAFIEHIASEKTRLVDFKIRTSSETLLESFVWFDLKKCSILYIPYLKIRNFEFNIVFIIEL